MRAVTFTIVGLIAALLALDLATDEDSAAVAPGVNREFVSRPDLRPPVLSVEGKATGSVFFAPKRRSGQSGPAIVDASGEYVWFKPLPKGTIANDFRVQTYKGQPVLTWWEGATGNRGYGSGTWVIADQSYREIARVRAGDGQTGDLHDMTLTPEGTALITIYDEVPANLRPVGAFYDDGEAVDSIIQEIDVASGKVVWEWHSLDHVDLTESFAGEPRQNRFPYDYFHINSIDVGPDGNLLVSARNTWALYKLDRKTGDVIWRLGGYRSDFALGEGVRFAWQHDARWQPDGTITIFDNEATPKVRDHTRIIRIRLDEQARKATLVRSLEHPDGILSNAEGNAQTLADGSVMVGWGISRRVTEFGPRGNVRFDLTMPADVDSYRAYSFGWTGIPADPPTFVLTAKGVAASWNGATGITRWQVLAGASPDNLKPVAEAPRSGFETLIKTRVDEAYVAVRAFAGDRELGTSPAHELGER